MQLLAGAKLVFCTLSEVPKLMSHPDLREHVLPRIQTAIIDEAGTVPEYQIATLSGLCSLQRIVCIGDVKQLPPFTLIEKRAPRGFLERAQDQLRRAGTPVPMLSVQFRMNKTSKSSDPTPFNSQPTPTSQHLCSPKLLI